MFYTDIGDDMSKTNADKKKVNNNLVKVYIYNTHQSEEYAATKFGTIPNVMTASDILYEELKDLNVFSVVEKRDVNSEVKKRGYDYSGTYTISFEYLQDSKKKNPSLEYFFDIHRDSITGDASKVKIGNNSYATMMFLIGANHKDYEKNLANVNIMKNYLDKNYKGLVRDNYIQKKWTYYQYYSPKMFLVEIGGPNNTFEEVYNTISALAESIKYYMEVNDG